MKAESDRPQKLFQKLPMCYWSRKQAKVHSLQNDGFDFLLQALAHVCPSLRWALSWNARQWQCCIADLDNKFPVIHAGRLGRRFFLTPCVRFCLFSATPPLPSHPPHPSPPAWPWRPFRARVYYIGSEPGFLAGGSVRFCVICPALGSEPGFLAGGPEAFCVICSALGSEPGFLAGGPEAFCVKKISRLRRGDFRYTKIFYLRKLS